MMRRAMVMLGACVLIAACARIHHASPGPHIDAVQPDSVLLAQGAVVTVTVRGSGFDRGKLGRNTIQFGTLTIPDVPATSDGREIRLTIPDRVPSRGGAAPLPLEAGRYAIRVQTRGGTSNAVALRVER